MVIMLITIWLFNIAMEAMAAGPFIDDFPS